MVGDTVTVAELAGFEPELAVHVNGAEPLDDKTTLCPEQILETEGVMLIDGIVETEIDATADAVQVPVPDNTV